MRRDNSNTVPTRHRRRRALLVVAATLVPILALALVAGHFLAQPVRASGSVSFAAAVNYPVSVQPQSEAIGDFNGDTHPDLVIANPNSNVVTVLLGSSSGDGTFTFSNNYPVLSGPRSVAIGDLNGDGHPDLATANQSSNNVTVLLGTGDGTFTFSANYAVGTGPTSVAVGSLNGDTHPDLVVANGDDNDVSVLLGTGDGTFATAVNYGVGTGPVSVAVGDLNGDTHPDLVTSNSSNNVSVLLGSSSGDGTFLPSLGYAVNGIAPDSVAIGDLNGDGHPDLVTADSGNNIFGFVSVLLGSTSGDGTFPTAAVTYGVDTQPESVAIGDLNGDNKPDLVTASFGGNDVSVLLSNGDGTFPAPVMFPVNGTGPVSVAIGNLNNDSQPDLVTANFGSANVSVLLNTTAGGAPTPTPTGGGGGSNSTQVTLALTGGGLSASTTAAPSLSATLTGQDQTLNYLLPISVTDARATGDGWNLTITSTQFSTSGSPVNTLPTTASTVISAGSVCAAGSCVDPMNSVGYPLTIPAGTTAPPPVKLFNAAVGTGMGTFTVTPSVNILIPGSTVAGTYTSTITLAIVSGP